MFAHGPRVPMSQTWSREQEDGLSYQLEQRDVAKALDSPTKASETTE